MVSRDSQLSNFFSPIVMSWQSNMFWPWVLRFSHIQSLETKFITDGFFTALLSILPKAHFDWASKIYHQSNHNSHIRGRKISRKEKLKKHRKTRNLLEAREKRKWPSEPDWLGEWREFPEQITWRSIQNQRYLALLSTLNWNSIKQALPCKWVQYVPVSMAVWTRLQLLRCSTCYWLQFQEK